MASITTQEAKAPRRRRFGGAREEEGPPRPPRARLSWRIRLRRDKSLLLMTIPALLLLLLFNYLPMAGIIVAFEHYDIYTGLVHSDFVGLDEFRQLVANPDFWHAFRTPW